MDVDRTIEFLLQQQAQFAAQFAEQSAGHDHRLSRAEAILVDLAQSGERTNAIVEVLAERQVKTEEELAHLANRQAKTEEELADLTSKLEALTESVQILIQLFQRHITNH